MKRRIPRLRRTAQVLFFLLTLIVFEGSSTGSYLIQFYNGLHFMPPMAAWIAGGVTVWALVTAGLLLVSLLIGRFYCGWLCPVGFWQDIAAGEARKLKLPVRKISLALHWRLGVLIAAVIAFAAGAPLLGYIDHFSQLGMILRGVLLPALATLVRILSMGTLQYSHLVEIHFNADLATFWSLFFFALLYLLSRRYPRAWCDLLCPSGTVFIILQRFSFLEPAPQDNCPVCRVCDRQCPVLSMDKGIVDSQRCIGCLECLEFCPSKSFGLRSRYRQRVITQPLNGTTRRRMLLAGSGGMAGLLAGLGGAHWFVSADPAAADVAVPPGAGSRDDYFTRCIGCSFCVAVCPTGVLRPAGIDHETAMLFRPILDFKKSYCSYECIACAEVCPTGAIDLHPLADKKRIRVGSAKLDKEICIPFKNKKDCGACAEVCPTQSVHMIPQGAQMIPELKPELCIGCGHCEMVCPTQPRKSIWVEPLRLHEKADSPLPKNPGKMVIPEDNKLPF